MGQALKGGYRDKVFLMTKVCTHGRDASVAMQMLEESLGRLGTGHLDLWQLHAVVYDNDPELAYRTGGAIEALDQAKKQGKVRYVGFTGHKDPRIHKQMIDMGYAWDAVQFPINAFDAQFRSFQQVVLPDAIQRGIAVLGMKPLNGDGASFHHAEVKLTPQQALRYAMSVPGVTTTITGMESLAVLRQNLAVAKDFQPMSQEQMQQLVGAVQPLRATAASKCTRRHCDMTMSLRVKCTSSRSMAPTREVEITAMPVPHRQLKGASVSIIGVGGSALGDIKDDSEAGRIVSEALENGINFFDNAWEYHDGMSEEHMGRALKGKRDQAFLMTKVCSHGRKRDVAMQMLEDSLRRLQTDHLDLWQIHEVIYDNDPDLHFAPDGTIEALTQAKQQGKVRFVGFTGHKDPDIHLKMLSHNYPFDTVQMPLNPFDRNYRSFQQRVIPEARRQGIMPIGMKSMGGGEEPVKRGVATPEELLRYAMSVPDILATVSGMDSYDVFRQNLAIALNFKPLAAGEMAALENRVKAVAGDGRLEHYKATKLYDAEVGRRQHGFPSPKELPA